MSWRTATTLAAATASRPPALSRPSRHSPGLRESCLIRSIPGKRWRVSSTSFAKACTRKLTTSCSFTPAAALGCLDMSMILDLAAQRMPAQPDSKSMHRIVGIIGGMGPEATVDLMRRVVAKTPANDDQDHIHLIVESNPKIPSRIAHLIDGTGADPTPELIRIAGNLQRAGAEALAIPCNTAHAYAHSIRRAVSIPLLDMVSLTVDQIANSRRVARVGLLVSSAVLATELYARSFAGHGIDVVHP